MLQTCLYYIRNCLIFLVVKFAYPHQSSVENTIRCLIVFFILRKFKKLFNTVFSTLPTCTYHIRNGLIFCNCKVRLLSLLPTEFKSHHNNDGFINWPTISTKSHSVEVGPINFFLSSTSMRISFWSEFQQCMSSIWSLWKNLKRTVSDQSSDRTWPTSLLMTGFHAM